MPAIFLSVLGIIFVVVGRTRIGGDPLIQYGEGSVKRRSLFISALCLCLGSSAASSAQGPSAAELARKAQDPLGDVRAIMTDNTISFGTSDNDTAYGFQILPAYSIPTDRGYNLIARAVIPIVGAPVGASLPRLGGEPISDEGATWGLSDSILQLFWTPSTTSAIKWGIGPQVSLRTRTSDQVGGPGWGGGIAGVVFGSAGDLAYGSLLMHHWGEEGYSVTSLQPIVYYNVSALPGSYVGYNNAITYNWDAGSGDRWQLPLGLTFGRTFPVGSAGHALDLSLGGYSLVVKPDGGADWQLKFGISVFFP